MEQYPLENKWTNKPGRPGIYDPRFHIPSLEKLMREGKTDAWIYSEWNVSADTFYRWLREYPELKETHQIGLQHCEKYWETLGMEMMASGENKKFSFWIAFMRRKFGKVWANPEARDAQTTNINISQMNVLQHKSPDELLEFIGQGLDYLKDNNILEAEFKVLEENTNGSGQEKPRELEEDSGSDSSATREAQVQ